MVNVVLRDNSVSGLGIPENEARAHWARLEEPTMKDRFDKRFQRGCLKALDEAPQLMKHAVSPCHCVQLSLTQICPPSLCPSESIRASLCKA